MWAAHWRWFLATGALLITAMAVSLYPVVGVLVENWRDRLGDRRQARMMSTIDPVGAIVSAASAAQLLRIELMSKDTHGCVNSLHSDIAADQEGRREMVKVLRDELLPLMRDIKEALAILLDRGR